MNNVADFHNLHEGQTCLIVGVGPNLNLTPPEWFDYPSLGVNSIYKYQGWKPTYYVGVDERLRVENGKEICRVFRDIPKFFPTPDWDDLQGENIFRFVHRDIGNLFVGGQSPHQREALTQWGITYYRIMGAVMQIACYMGFKTALMIGIQHAEGAPVEHFWGHDSGAVADQPLSTWFTEYSQWAHGTRTQFLNISEDTHVPENVIPRDDWRKWKNK